MERVESPRRPDMSGLCKDLEEEQRHLMLAIANQDCSLVFSCGSLLETSCMMYQHRNNPYCNMLSAGNEPYGPVEKPKGWIK